MGAGCQVGNRDESRLRRLEDEAAPSLVIFVYDVYIRRRFKPSPFRFFGLTSLASLSQAMALTPSNALVRGDAN